VAGSFEPGNELLGSIKSGKFFNQLSDIFASCDVSNKSCTVFQSFNTSFLKRTLFHGAG
jgi:hypothetical protein